MISIDLLQTTAETLMDKAAIEIPQDYLDGLQNAAKTEDGDLSWPRRKIGALCVAIRAAHVGM